MNKHLTETELAIFKNYWDRCVALSRETKKRKTYTLDELQIGDYIIGANGSDKGLGFRLLKLNKRSAKLRMYGVVSPKNNRHCMAMDERVTTRKLEGYEFYLATRSEMALYIACLHLVRNYGSYERVIKNIKLQKFSEDYVKEENQRLDKIVERYSLTKDCDCITHEGSCFIHHQRYWIGKNAEILTTGSLFADRAFITDEHARLVELSREMARLDHEYPGKTDNELLSIDKFRNFPGF